MQCGRQLGSFNKILHATWQAATSRMSRTLLPPPAAKQKQTAAGQASNSSFIFLTYNILASKYATGGNHNYCEAQYLAWPHRLKQIKEELKAHAAHIVCLQEVEDVVFKNQLQPWFQQQGMQGFYMARQSGEVQGPPEGVAMFVSKDVFETLKVKTVQYADHAQDVAHSAIPGSEGWQVFITKEEGAVVVLLKHRPTGQHLVAACTHLFWNPRYPDVKALQAAVLCQQLARFVQQEGQGSSPAALPVILGGDFNSLPRKTKPDIFDKVIPSGPDGLVSGVYTLFTTGTLPVSHPDHPATRQASRENRQAVLGTAKPLDDAGLNLSSCYWLANGREPYFTTKTASFAGTLDYIFINDGHFRIEAVLGMPVEFPEDADAQPIDADFPAIPDETFPSDHLAIACEVTLYPNASRGSSR